MGVISDSALFMLLRTLYRDLYYEHLGLDYSVVLLCSGGSVVPANIVHYVLYKNLAAFLARFRARFWPQWRGYCTTHFIRNVVRRFFAAHDAHGRALEAVGATVPQGGASPISAFPPPGAGGSVERSVLGGY